MASCKPYLDSKGTQIGWRFRLCIYTDDGKQWKTKTIPMIGLTPAAERKEAERQAEEWDREIRADVKQGLQINRDKMTLADFVMNYWLADHIHDGKHTPSSIQNIEGKAKRIVDYFGKRQILSELNAIQLKRYFNHLRNDNAPGMDKAYAESSQVAYKKVLASILNYAQRLDFIKSNPLAKLRPTDLPHDPPHEITFLDSAEAKRFLACADKIDLYHRAAIYVLLYTGIRRGELMGLKWDDIDEEQMTIRIVRNVTPVANAEEKIYVGPTKGKHQRILPLAQPALEALMSLKTSEKENGKEYCHEDSYIFHGSKSYDIPEHPAAIYAYIKRFIRKNNLPDISVHDLRHTAASLAVEAGVDLRVIQTLLGHHDYATTSKYYAGVSAKVQRAAVEGITKLLSQTETD